MIDRALFQKTQQIIEQIERTVSELKAVGVNARIAVSVIDNLSAAEKTNITTLLTSLTDFSMADLAAKKNILNTAATWIENNIT